MFYYPSRIFRNTGRFENWEILTIRHVARKGYRSIAHKSKPNGLLPGFPKGEGSNCFSITLLVGQKR